MKGNVSRPRWPAPAANTSATTHPKTSKTDLKTLAEPRIDPANQITTLAIVEEAVLVRTHGYDPYNKPVPGPRPVDAWQRKRKRD